MASKREQPAGGEEPVETQPQEEKHGLLQSAAQAIGSAAGTIATLGKKPKAPSKPKGEARQKKFRLPRKQKKALKKAAAKQKPA